MHIEAISPFTELIKTQLHSYRADRKASSYQRVSGALHQRQFNVMSLHSLMSKVGKRFLLTFAHRSLLSASSASRTRWKTGVATDVIRQVSLSETSAPIMSYRTPRTSIT